jgi:hypothetical protein
MMHFKREMLNREENYNKKFNRSPTVGVMQVIKPKNASEVSQSAPMRRHTGELSASELGSRGAAIGMNPQTGNATGPPKRR